jgi:hypothetical protein
MLTGVYIAQAIGTLGCAAAAGKIYHLTAKSQPQRTIFLPLQGALRRFQSHASPTSPCRLVALPTLPAPSTKCLVTLPPIFRINGWTFMIVVIRYSQQLQDLRLLQICTSSGN